MAIWASKGSAREFTPAPAGAHAAVCVDVIDLGPVEKEFQGEKKIVDQIRLVWLIAEVRDDGEPYLVSRNLTRSLHDRAALRALVEGWLGTKLTDEDLPYDLESLIGRRCLLNISHRISATTGRTYANVQAVMPLPKGVAPEPGTEIPYTYTRLQDRKDTKEPAPF